MKKRVGVPCLVVLCLVANCSIAEPSTSDLSTVLPKACLMAGNFQQSKHLPGISEALESQGEFIFHCQQGLIWQTNLPHPETLVYRLDGKHQLLLPDSEAERLNSRVHRELGKILNNLIGADLEYLNRHFDQYRDGTHYTLVPKRKRLRNYIASIALLRAEAGVQISIAQRDDELSIIDIQQTQVFDSLDLETCVASPSLHPMACALLLQ